MEYWTSNCEGEVAEILGHYELPDDKRPPRREQPENAPESSRLQRKVVQACFTMTLIALLINFNFFSPQPTVRVAPQADLSGNQAAAHQNWRVSSIFVPMLGEPLPVIAVDSPQAMIGQLKRFGLWKLKGDRASEVPPVVFANFPDQLSEMDVQARKKIFLHSLLPVTLVAMAEVEQERVELQKILRKLGGPEGLVFSDEHPAWQEKLSSEEKIFIATVTEKYRTKKAAELLDRINVLPVSLVLAQGAFESFWGTSRFAREGNNLFGMWTWGKKGIVPARRDPGKTHKLAVYDSILDAVRTFVLTINRLPAYKRLRMIRRRTMNSLAIANGLYYYSTRGRAYIADVKRIIRRDGLTRYDRFELGDVASLPPPVPTAQLASL